MNLENVKVGDRLMSTSGNTFSNKKPLRLSYVERLTKTQIVLSNGEKIKKTNGRQIGSGGSVWNSYVNWISFNLKLSTEISNHNFQVDLDRATKELSDLGLLKKSILVELIDRVVNE